jgi:hypothetical protein
MVADHQGGEHQSGADGVADDTKEVVVSIRESRKSRAGTTAIVSKIRRTQRRAVEAAPHGHPFRENTANLPRRRFLHLAAGAAALPGVSRIAEAQTYPTRPITLVVPFPPGGQTDVIARNLAERLKASLGQPVIIENVTGAGGSIGVGRVALRPATVTRSAWAKTTPTS